MQHARSTLKKILADTLRREGDNAPVLAWPLVCGARIAEKTNAIGYADGVLTVEVADAGLAAATTGPQPAICVRAERDQCAARKQH